MELVRFNFGRLTLCATLLLSHTGIARATDYYVATNGSDARSCAQARNITTPKVSIFNALFCLTAGDTLQVRGGTYTDFIDDSPSGTSWSNPVRVKAYNSETVWLNPSGWPYAIYFAQRQQYIEFDGINIDARNTALGAPVKIEGWGGGNAHHIRIKNAELISGGDGIPNQGTAGGGSGVIATAIVPGVVGGNEFINLRVHGGGDPGDFAYGFYIQSSDNLIDNCDIYDVSGAGVQIYNGYGLPASNNVLRNNTIHDISRSGDWRAWGIIIADGDDNAVYNNLIYGINLPGYGNAGISVYSGDRARVFNNTLYGSAGAGIYITFATQTQVVNNISYANSGGNYINYGSGTFESNNLTGNPSFVNPGGRDFRLNANSAAIDRGAYLGEVSVDKLGVGRPQGSGYDIGAYEYGSGAPAQQPPPQQPPAPPSGGQVTSGASPSGTRIPGASQIVDNSLAVWTLGSGLQVLRNGSQIAGGYGSQILFFEDNIYVLGDDSNWWRWTGTWSFAGANDPSGGAAPAPAETQAPQTPQAPSASPSQNGTRIPGASSITDNSLAVWTLGSSLQILRNGSQVANGYGSVILWYQNSIYVLGDDNNWWRWTGSTYAYYGPSSPI